VIPDEIDLRFDGKKAKTEKAKIEKEEELKAMVKVKTKTKSRWENEKLVWKSTWVPKCFQPTTKEYG